MARVTAPTFCLGLLFVTTAERVEICVCGHENGLVGVLGLLLPSCPLHRFFLLVLLLGLEDRSWNFCGC